MTAAEAGEDRDDVPRRRRRSRHRRVWAPPTNPEADQSDDVTRGSRVSRAGSTPEGEERPDSARDAWIRAQRPPHWD